METDILEQLLDQVNMCHDHTPATVTLAANLVHGVSESCENQKDRRASL
jgi:hypothetical protein